MKNIFRVLALSSLMLPFSSCMFEQEDFFDENSSARIEHAKDDIQSILCSQSADGKHGWVLQYFVAGTEDSNFEGFLMNAKFAQNGSVTLAGNHRYLRNGQAGKYTEHNSLYQMLSEEGPIISFCTWNNILTVLSDPVDPAAAPTTISQDGQGMCGDYNLVVTSFNEKEILLRGERYGTVSRMIPMDRPAEEYFDAVKAIGSKIANSTITTYYIVNGADTLFITTGMKAGLPILSERLVGGLMTTYMPCVFTPEGFRLGKPATIGDKNFQEFILDEEKGMLVSESGVQCIPMWDAYIPTHTDLWVLDESLFTQEQKDLVEQIDGEIRKYNTAWSLKNLSIGKSTGASSQVGIVMTFYTNTTKTKTNTAGFKLNMSRSGYAEETIAIPDPMVTDGNFNSIAKKATNMKDLVNQFAKTLVGVYSVVPNNPYLPTGATLAPKGDSGTQFIMQK